MSFYTSVNIEKRTNKNFGIAEVVKTAFFFIPKHTRQIIIKKGVIKKIKLIYLKTSS